MLENEITKLITDFSYEFDSKRIPQSSFDILDISIADWIAVSTLGKNEEVSKIVLKMAQDNGGCNESFVIGSNVYLPASLAALVNGTTSHALDYDDTHFDYVGHPSVVVVSAMFAVAQKMKVNKEKFNECCLLGLELTCRIGKWLGRKHYRTGFHITATAGALGATLGLARLMNLNREQTINAFGIACSKASGVKAQFGTMGKPYHAGIAASSAVESVNLAKNNFVSYEKALEGKQGFGETHHSEFNKNAFDNLGQEFIFEKVIYKYHACCHGIHSTIEALLKIKETKNLISENINKIEILVHPQWLNVCNIEKPRSGLESKFSYKLVTGLVVNNYDTGKIKTFSDKICKESKITKIRDLVEVKTSNSSSESGSNVKIFLKNDEVFESEYDLKDLTNVNKKEKKMQTKMHSLLGENYSTSLWSFIKNDKKLPISWIQEYLK